MGKESLGVVGGLGVRIQERVKGVWGRGSRRWGSGVKGSKCGRGEE